MFTKARIKLTGWYLFIIMLISISFSLAIYESLTMELGRVERAQKLRQERLLSTENFQRVQRLPIIDPEVITETKERIKMTLLLINFGIFVAAGLSGYFLAGRTLKPISDMVEEQERFITDASHELRTPLTSLKSEIEVNLRDEKLNLESAKTLLKSNLEEVNNLQYLSDNLIKLTQFQRGNSAKFEIINLANIFNEAEKKLAKIAKFKKITIKADKHTESIFADRQSILELMVILLDNAIKYSPVGKNIKVSSERNDSMVLVKVTDHGTGISKEDLPHIFDRFYRADKSRTKMGISGYGLGLSIARQIVEKHKGTIKVESELKKGSTFIISLPVK